MEPSDVLLCPAMPPTTDTPLPLVMFREPIRDRQVDNICPLRVNWPSNTHFVMPAAPCPSPRPPARGWATRSPTTRAFIRREGRTLLDAMTTPERPALEVCGR